MPFFQDSPFKPVAELPIYRQLYDYLRGAILSGQLKMGTRLPSTRALAGELNVSRNTVLGAYEQLVAEGYLESAGGSGTFVTRTLPDSMLAPRRERKRAQPPQPRAHRLSDQAESLAAAPRMPVSPSRRPSLPFEAGTSALDRFPFGLWAKLVARHAAALHPGMMAYGDHAGYRPLREAIASHVLIARQVRCAPEQVIVVAGSQSALYLAARVLLNRGDSVWLEDPGYIGARRAMMAAGARIVPVPVDADGMRVEEGIARAPDARLAYLTPSHQFPLGVTLSLRRRLDLLAWARRAGSYILEDDYDSEYRFEGRPLASLQGLDDAGSVIYIGTFSKVMFPALRIGYLIVPPGLIDAFLAYRTATDYHLPTLEQAALTDFIAEGHFTRHIRRMRTLYGERRDTLIDALRDSPLDVTAPETGMHLIGWLPSMMSDTDAAQRAAEHQIRALPVSTFSIEAPLPGGLLLGYAAVEEREIQRGARALIAALGW